MSHFENELQATDTSPVLDITFLNNFEIFRDGQYVNKPTVYHHKSLVSYVSNDSQSTSYLSAVYGTQDRHCPPVPCDIQTLQPSTGTNNMSDFFKSLVSPPDGTSDFSLPPSGLAQSELTIPEGHDLCEEKNCVDERDNIVKLIRQVNITHKSRSPLHTFPEQNDPNMEKRRQRAGEAHRRREKRKSDRMTIVDHIAHLKRRASHLKQVRTALDKQIATLTQLVNQTD